MSIFKNVSKRFIYFFVAMIVLAGTNSYGQDSQGTPTPEKQKKISVSGTVNHVDAIAGTITISGEKGVTTISVSDDVKIMRKSEKLHLDEINTGDDVLVQCYNPEPGKYVAVSIMDSSAV